MKLANLETGQLIPSFYSRFALNRALPSRIGLPPTKRFASTASNMNAMEKKSNVTRKSGRHLRVPVLPIEEEAIKAKAAEAGLSIAAYLRNVGMGYPLKSMMDARLVLQLAKINGDQGRLGGLLKLWLTNSEKLGPHDPEQMRRVIHGVLERIVTMQTEMLKLVKME